MIRKSKIEEEIFQLNQKRVNQIQCNYRQMRLAQNTIEKLLSFYKRKHSLVKNYYRMLQQTSMFATVVYSIFSLEFCSYFNVHNSFLYFLGSWHFALFLCFPNIRTNTMRTQCCLQNNNIKHSCTQTYKFLKKKHVAQAITQQSCFDQ